MTLVDHLGELELGSCTAATVLVILEFALLGGQ